MPENKQRSVLQNRYTGMHMDVGKDMLIRPSQSNGDYKSTLVGMHPFEFLILKVPSLPGLQKLFPKNSEVIARYLCKGVVYGFTSQVLEIIRSPENLLFLAYPFHYESLSLRKNNRIQCLTPCKAYNEEGEYAGYIIDLGAGGCRINFERSKGHALLRLPLGSALYLDFTLCGSNKLFVLKCLLRHVLADDKKISVGMKFAEVPAGQLEHLTEYIQKISEVC